MKGSCQITFISRQLFHLFVL